MTNATAWIFLVYDLIVSVYYNSKLFLYSILLSTQPRFAGFYPYFACIVFFCFTREPICKFTALACPLPRMDIFTAIHFELA